MKILCGTIFAAACAANGTTFDVRDYGAKGDGETFDSPAVQQAVDAAFAAGGGVVAVGPGKYVVANLEIKDGVTLRLAKDAVLLGSTNIVDYVGRKERFKAVVSTFDAQNIAIVGEGTIDGRGWAAPIRDGAKNRWRDVHFYRCRDVRVENVTMKNPAFWTFYLQECENCVVRGVTIFAHANYNNDGIDIDAKNVLVEDCVIDSDDDAICPKSNNPGFVCENIEVRNCVLSSNCNFIKFGTASHGGFRNCHVHDCVLKPCAVSNLRRWNKSDCEWYGRVGAIPGVTDAITGLSAIALEMVDGGIMESIRISDITFDEGGVQTPVFVRLGRRKEYSGVKSRLRNCVIENVRGKTASFIASSITGVPGLRVENITLRNLDLTLKAGGTAADVAVEVPEQMDLYPENRMFASMLPAAAFYVRHADGVSFEKVRTRYCGGREERPPVVTDDCSRVVFDGKCSF
ncbi:MAG: right-handed parallel beta-helix repeat-containing protein [Kiritimatiellae bacterium]|nr:right-handed parallel beta-helix repeat-containing protein [Kiritimatiellia bacterium]